MSAKSDKFYFENFVEAAECSCKAAAYMADCLSDYKSSNMKEMLETVHSFEHQGDMLKHAMSTALVKAFVTPIDREDLALISQNIDDVSDCIEEVIQNLYMFRVEKVPPEACIFAKKIYDCCILMKEMFAELEHFKKPDKLHEMIVGVNSIEEECDNLFLDSIYKLPDYCNDTLEIISWREIYNKMENCADACEHVGDCVEMVVMKNS